MGRKVSQKFLEKYTQNDVRWVLHNGEHHARIARQKMGTFCGMIGVVSSSNPEEGSPEDAKAPACSICAWLVREMPAGERRVGNTRKPRVQRCHSQARS
jgi:hypothetical protein